LKQQALLAGSIAPTADAFHQPGSDNAAGRKIKRWRQISDL